MGASAEQGTKCFARSVLLAQADKKAFIAQYRGEGVARDEEDATRPGRAPYRAWRKGTNASFQAPFASRFPVDVRRTKKKGPL